MLANVPECALAVVITTRRLRRFKEPSTHVFAIGDGVADDAEGHARGTPTLASGVSGAANGRTSRRKRSAKGSDAAWWSVSPSESLSGSVTGLPGDSMRGLD